MIKSSSKSLLALALVAAVLTGCGSDTGDDAPVDIPDVQPSASNTTAPPSPAAVLPTPSPSPAVLNKEQAGERYLELVEPANQASDELFALLAATDNSATAGNLEQAKEISVRVAEGDRLLAEGLTETEWPEAVAVYVEQLIDEVITQRSISVQMSTSPTAEAFNEGLDELSSQFDPRSVERIRLELGLTAAS